MSPRGLSPKGVAANTEVAKFKTVAVTTHDELANSAPRVALAMDAVDLGAFFFPLALRSRAGRLGRVAAAFRSRRSRADERGSDDNAGTVRNWQKFEPGLATKSAG